MALVIDSVSKRFGEVQALDNVSLEIQPGEVFGFLGANGAGKTTAMRVVLDILRPDSGTVTWGGRSNTSSRTRPGLPAGGAGPLRQDEGPRPAGLLRQAARRETKAAERETRDWLDRFASPSTPTVARSSCRRATSRRSSSSPRFFMTRRCC